MPTFAYTAKDRQGRILKKISRASNSRDLVSKLRQQGLTVTDIRQEKRLSNISLFQPRVKVEDLAIFSRGFATMVGAGVNLGQALDITVKQTENPTLSKAISDIKEEVEGGMSLTEALGKYPNIFSNLYVNMVKAGESSGNLEVVLNRLAEIMEKQREINNKVKSAMFMPILVFGFCVLITLGLLIFIVPRFAMVFAEVGAGLPAPTLILLKVSEALRGPMGGIALLVIILIAFVFSRIIKTEKGRYAWDKTKLKLPLFGSLTIKKVTANFSRTLGMLQSSGVPILESLEIVADSSGNVVVAEAIREASTSIQQGDSISRPLEKSQIFPPMLVHMVVVGEETGSLEAMLNKLADFYEDDVDRTIEGLLKLIEPLMMIFIGAIVGGILIALYLPIFTIAGALSGD